ncbi:ribonuclease H-like domain-containing protein [Tanacetum coccineum]
MTDLGALNYFLGSSADRTPTESKLGPEGVPVQDLTLYRSLARGLQYLTFTHPDLSYAIQQIFLYMHDPREPHFAALKRILRYVRGTVDFGLHLYVFATTSLVGYTDADWVGCPSTCRSTLDYCLFFGDNLLSWSAKRQHTISRSSAKAEYRSVANIVAETAWVRNLLRELHSPLMTATLVYCDNVSAVYMSANPVQHQRTKHIMIDIQFVLDMVTASQVYDAKVSIRCKLRILQTIRSKLSWKGERLGIFSRTVFRPWLNIQTTLHDNHLLNFLLQHQRYVEDLSIGILFIFNIDGRTIELGRQAFCLITGFRFGRISLDLKEKDHSKFNARVFPETPNLNGDHLLELVKNDVAFNNLDDDDVWMMMMLCVFVCS